MNGTKRADIKHGMSVAIVLKQDQQSGRLTDGIVRDILTSSPMHHHGIKVRLMSGEVGRVKEIY
ncbi:MAG: YwbE family protein [Campylobacterales bacterium]|nr:YwbE family protein [Campylobacterales bacterium]